MEFQAFPYPIIFSIILVIFIALGISYKFKAKSLSISKLPPGPQKLPFIGNLHQLYGALPQHALHDLAQKHGPLMHIQLGEVPHLIVSSAELAKEVMKTNDLNFATRPRVTAPNLMSYGGIDIAFAPYGEYWRQVRKISTLEIFSAKKVQSFRSIREEEFRNLVQWATANAEAPVNLTQKLYTSTFTVTSKAAFGKKYKGHEAFIEFVAEATRLGAGFGVGDLFPSMKLLHFVSGLMRKLEKLHREGDRILDNIIEEHRERRGNRIGATADDDLVDVLLGFAESSGHGFSLSMDNIKAIILDVFAAGSETSATTMDWAMAEMIRNPVILKKAQAEVREVFDKRGEFVDETGLPELKYLRMVIKETLRMHPALPLLLPRECRQKCEINGYEIPEKTRVLVNAWAIGQDSKYWNDPKTFYPERFQDSSVNFKGNSFEFVPFGAGRRICPGMTFGMVSVELALAMLLYHFDWELPSGMTSEDLDMVESFGMTQRRKEDLMLVPKPYCCLLTQGTVG